MTAISTRELTIFGKSTLTELIEVRSLKSLTVKGLGATYNSSNIYDDKMQDYNTQYNMGVQISLDNIVTGGIEKSYIDNPFQRMHQSIEDYPDFLDDIDDVGMMEYDNFERLKPFQAKKGTTVGETPIIPTEDNDQKLYFYDVQGESVYTNPPDSNSPTIDHGVDEDFIWAFQRTGYNQLVVKNQYLKSPWAATQQLHQPHWGTKLFTPTFFKEEKLPKFFKQWELKVGLEKIKMRQAMHYRPGDKVQQKQFKNEIEAYLQHAEDVMANEELKDVYVTDHQPKPKKYFTISKSEDELFFKYKQSLDEYNKEKSLPKALPSEGKYERGSLLQLMLDPFAGGKRLENGALFYKVEDKELDPTINNDEKLRAIFEKLKANIDAPSEISEEDMDELRIEMLNELEELSPQTLDEFEDFLDKEFSVFKNGEKYNFVKDLKEAFSEGLATTQADKILNTIPEHVFWDIKKP